MKTLIPNGPTLLLPSDTRGFLTFKVENHGGQLIRANNAAADFARRYTSEYPSTQGPRLWVEYDKQLHAYFIRPNHDYVPAKNAAWLALLRDAKVIS